MKQQRVANALILSLLISGACTYVLARSIHAHAAPVAVPDIMYVAPSKSLKAGEILKPDSLEMLAWPANRPLRNAFLKRDDLVGRVVLYPMEKGEPVLDRDLAAAGAGVGLAASIPDGMRAIALRSDEVVGVAGFLNPGSHVDVLVTFRSSQSPDPITATVLQDEQVIAIGQKAQPDPEGKPTLGTVVTLLLTPEEAERAVLASTQGSVRFLLRNGEDVGHTEPPPMQLSMLAGLPSPPRPAKAEQVTAPVRKAATPETGIETVLGNQSSTDKQNAGAQP